MSTIKVNVIEPYSGSTVSIIGLEATASNALWSGISGIPAGLVSGSYSSSMSTRITAQEDFSSSLDATFATEAELNAATASLSGSASTSRQAIADDLNTVSSSLSSRVTSQENFSSSLDATFATDAQLNAATSSLIDADLVVSGGASNARNQLAADYIAADSTLSGSASDARNQLATDYIAADTTLSGSASDARNQLATDIATNTSDISTLNGKTLFSGSAQVTLGGDLSGTANNATVAKVQGVALTSGEATQLANINSSTISATQWGYVGALDQGLTTTSNITSSNLLVSNNLVVNGTASFALLQSVTGSAKIIGDAYIILNNNTPAERYAGIVVQDSGSAGVTSSLEFDGQTNDWFYEYSDDGGVTTDHGVVIFGPEYNTKGSPTYLTEGTIPKSTGSHHIVDSNITDNGSLITLGSNTSITGTVVATGTTLVSGSAQIDLASATGTAANATSASFATTASHALNAGGGLTAQTASTSLTMSANVAYVVTGTAAPITMSLPASPSVGDLIKFANMDDRATLLGRNSSNIMGLAEDMTLNVEQVSFDLVYVGPTAGWTIYGSRALS